MLDNGTLAADETQFPMTETLHESLEDTMLSSPAAAPAHGSAINGTTSTPHDRLEETLVPDEDDDDEDTSHVMSQELMPLSQSAPLLVAAGATLWRPQSSAPPTPMMSPQLNTSPDRGDMPHTIPLDFEPFSRTTSLATLPIVPVTVEPIAYFVTAVCNQPTHVDAFEAALAQGNAFKRVRDLARVVTPSFVVVRQAGSTMISRATICEHTGFGASMFSYVQRRWTMASDKRSEPSPI